MRGLRPIVLLMMVSLLYSSSAALDPTGNDAGSGGDAGDGPDDALTVGAGNHRGRLTPTVDPEDWYVLNLQAGTYLELEWTPTYDDSYVEVALLGPGPDGDPLYLVDESFSGRIFHTVPRAGPWYVQISLGADPAPVEPVPYTLDISATQHSSFYTVSTQAATYVVEATFEKADLFFFSVRVDLDRYATNRSGEIAIFTEWHLERGGSSGHESSGMAARGGKWQFPDRTEAGEALPSAEFPVLIETAPGSDQRQKITALSNISGWVRVYALHAHPEVWTEIVMSSTGSMAVEGAEGGPVTSWTTKDLTDGDDILLPTYAKTDGGRLDVHVDGAYVGLFDPHDNPGRVIAPNGTTYEAGTVFNRIMGLVHPEVGTWGIELDQTERLSDAPDQLFYMGAPFPHLGLTPEPTEHCPKGPHCD